jgi:hypothetical protein
MPRAADYFGLLAYMFVMYGGLPGSDSLWLDSSQPNRRKKGSPRLRVVSSNDASKRQRKPAVVPSEAVA